MGVDARLLRRARTENARLDEAERQARLARADYHASVRQLHLAGGSLREIAHALGLSHQRVQQIVNEAGGSWWRLWRSRHIKRDVVCTFCQRSQSVVTSLIAGPNVYICDACVARTENALTCGSSALASGVRARCAFCGKRQNAGRPLIAEPAGNICGECLRLCRQILDDRVDKPAPE